MIDSGSLAMNHVVVRFESTALSGELAAIFECRPCGEPMWRESELEAWACSQCGYLLRDIGARQVADNARGLLENLIPSQKVEKRRTWGWVTWFLRLLGLREASKSLSS